MEFLNKPRFLKIVRMLEECAPGSFVVGGAVRDFLLGRERPLDLDIAVPGDGFSTARALAERMGEEVSFVPLDERRGTGRLVLDRVACEIVDIASLKGKTITEDLLARDFTINALAVGVTDLLQEKEPRIIDPAGGCGDLTAGRISACSDRAFHEDPLRVLRAFRFMAQLGFEVAEETLELIPPVLSSLPGVAGERLRDEFFTILRSGLAHRTVVAMDRHGVMESLFPELSALKGARQNTYHHLDVWGHTLETLRGIEILADRVELLFPVVASKITDYLRSEPVKGRSRLALLKLAALFHDAGKPSRSTVDPDGRIRFFGHEKESVRLFDEACARLRPASREMEIMRGWVRGHMRTMIFTAESVSKRSLHRLRREFKEDEVGLLLLFLADLGAAQGPARPPKEFDHAAAQVRSALESHFAEEEKPRPRLLNGRDLIDIFGMVPGPLLGKVLDRVAELQAIGEIGSRKDALNAVRKYLAEEGAEPK
jgi:tRNA nucleotidyltransferase/poly(A) polymerase